MKFKQPDYESDVDIPNTTPASSGYRYEHVDATNRLYENESSPDGRMWYAGGTEKNISRRKSTIGNTNS